MNLQSRIWTCLLFLISMQASSQESDSQEAGSIADTETQFLFINMLEFLGEFETEDGKWVSPEILGDDVFADLDTIDGGTFNGEIYDGEIYDGETSRTSNNEQGLLSTPGNED